MNDWNPDSYLQFRNERTQPSIDLVNRITAEQAPGNILDAGCGPGNSSRVLIDRWPTARLTGVDNSPAMIEEAKKDFPGQEWVLSDAAEYRTDKKFDLVFSNAAIQWIPDHDGLFRLF
jgi:trans-aconitate 2-methyltransferase